MNCINCKKQMTYYFTKKGFKILKCTHCKLLVVENVPEDLAPFYSEGYFTGDVTLDGYMDYELDKEVTKSTYVYYLDKIQEQLQGNKNPKLFEVGCATGFFLQLAKDRDFEVSGIDVSEYAIKKGQEKGLVVTVAAIEDITNDTKSDVIAMYDLIEHVKNPVDVLQRTRDMLVPGGLIVLTTPDAGSLWARAWGTKWHAFVPPQHLFYFSDKNLCEILTAHGFEVVTVAHHGKRFAIPYIIRLLYSWTGLKLFSKLAEWSSHSFLKNIAIPINLRDTAFIIARKKS